MCFEALRHPISRACRACLGVIAASLQLDPEWSRLACLEVLVLSGGVKIPAGQVTPPLAGRSLDWAEELSGPQLTSP